MRSPEIDLLPTIPVYANRKHGFTLVELLVVVAIISILAAMLLPTLEQALESTRRVKCAGNLKQLTMGAISYMDDFMGWFPVSDQWRGSFEPVAAWFSLRTTTSTLEGYLPWHVRQCPTIPFPSDWKMTTWPGSQQPMRYTMPSAFLYVNFSYPSAAAYYCRDLADASRYFVPLGRIDAKANAMNLYDRMPIFSDANFYYSSSGPNHVAHTRAGVDALKAAIIYTPPQGGNSAWMDGHVEWHNWPTGLNSWALARTSIPNPSTIFLGKSEGWSNAGDTAMAMFAWSKKR